MSLANYRSAIAEHVDSDVASRFELIAAMSLVTGDLDDDAGQALAAALCTADPITAIEHVSALTLSGVVIECAGRAANLAPHEAQAHPLVADWAPEMFGGALANAIAAGRIMTTLCPGAPIFENFHIFEDRGVSNYAIANLTFPRPEGDASVRLHYGAQPESVFARTSIVTGTAVFMVGVAVAALGDPPSPEDDEQGADPQGRADRSVTSVMGTLH